VAPIIDTYRKAPSSYHKALEMDVMNRDEALQEALKLIDPDDKLVEGTRQYKTIRAMILGWIDQEDVDKTLDNAKVSSKYLDIWWRVSSE
jgi:hypothetical protein